MAESYQILIVDDDPSIVNVIETGLSQAGYQVLTASNGNDACEMVPRHCPHLIIMDMMMPQCNGILATARIRQDSRDRSKLGISSLTPPSICRCIWASFAIVSTAEPSMVLSSAGS